jgi:hypothetical protein
MIVMILLGALGNTQTRLLLAETIFMWCCLPLHLPAVFDALFIFAHCDARRESELPDHAKGTYTGDGSDGGDDVPGQKEGGQPAPTGMDTSG